MSNPVDALFDLNALNQPRRTVVPAVLGNGDGATVEVAGRPGYHWVRLYGDINQAVPALNRVYAGVYGLQVEVSVSTDRDRGKATYEVIGLGSNEILTYSASGTPVPFDPYLAEHHGAHEWSATAHGRDVVSVYPRAIAPLRVQAMTPASMRLILAGGWYRFGYERKYVTSKYTQDFTSDIPASTGKAVLVDVCINGNTGSLAYVNGTEFDWTGWTDPLPASAYPDPVPGYVYCSTIILYYGMTTIVEACFRYECRPVWATAGGNGVEIGTSAERAAITDKSSRKGMKYFESDTSKEYLCDGTYWYASDTTWTLEQDQMLATEELGPLTTEDGQEIGIEVEP
jgi:hypothetical protein